MTSVVLYSQASKQCYTEFQVNTLLYWEKIGHDRESCTVLNGKVSTEFADNEVKK